MEIAAVMGIAADMQINYCIALVLTLYELKCGNKHVSAL
jgi:hypothetical protein